jgi:hypothetical protein
LYNPLLHGRGRPPAPSKWGGSGRFDSLGPPYDCAKVGSFASGMAELPRFPPQNPPPSSDFPDGFPLYFPNGTLLYLDSYESATAFVFTVR